MKKVLLLGFVLLAYFGYVYRFRLFVRDPLGSVARAGMPEGDAQVYVNYGDDVLIESDHPPAYLTLLQHGSPVAVPKQLKCLQYLVCLLDSYPDVPRFVLPGADLESMTGRQVRFRDERGREVEIKLR